MSPLRRSARAGKQADSGAASPPSLPSPLPSPSKPDRKRKRASPSEEASTQQQSPQANGFSALQDEEKEEEMVAATNGVANGDASHQQQQHQQQQQQQQQQHQQQQQQQHPQQHQQHDEPEPSANGAAAQTSTSPVSGMDEFRALLGIGVKVEREAEDLPQGREPDTDRFQLTLLEADAAKLRAVLSSLASEVMGLERPVQTKDVPAANGKGKSPERSDHLPFLTLQSALVKGTRLRDLREHVLSLRRPLLDDTLLQQQLSSGTLSEATRAKNKEEQEDTRSKLCSLTLVLSLIDQLARRYREGEEQGDPARGKVLAGLIEKRAENLEKRNKRLKSESPSDEAKPIEEVLQGGQRCLESGHVTGKFALHMRLPRGEFFTKPVYLEPETLEKLEAGQADLVAIAPQARGPLGKGLKRKGSAPAPTLGERSAASVTAANETTTSALSTVERDTLKPVAFLRYGNYASFAPSYDSAGATLSYAGSQRLWTSRAQARAVELSSWGKQAMDGELQGAAAAEKPQSISEPPRLESMAADPSTLDLNLEGLDESLDADMIKAGIDQLEQDEKISAQLQRNLILLKKLQEFQWDRLRKSYRPPAASAPTTTRGVLVEVVPSAEEEAVAEALFDSLVSLIAVQPHAAEIRTGTKQGTLPERETIRTFSHTIGAIDPALTADDGASGYWGTLDEASCGWSSKSQRSRNSATGSPGKPTVVGVPNLIRSNSTVRLTDESEARADRSGASTNLKGDRGRGMLERFASSRAYSGKEDRHNVNELASQSQPATATRKPASPDKAPAALQRTRSGGVPTTSSPSAAHTSASPAMPARSQSRGSLPPQQGATPSAASGHAAARYPQPGDSPYPGSRPASNGIVRPHQPQPVPPYQHHPAVRGYGLPPASSPGPGLGHAPSLGPGGGGGGGVSYAHAYTSPGRPPYGYHSSPAPTSMQHSMQAHSHPVGYPANAKVQVYPPSSPAKGFAYPSPSAQIQVGGYTDWTHQPQPQPHSHPNPHASPYASQPHRPGSHPHPHAHPHPQQGMPPQQPYYPQGFMTHPQQSYAGGAPQAGHPQYAAMNR